MVSASIVAERPVIPSSQGAVAPAWHTGVMLAALLGFSYVGAHIQHLTFYGRSVDYLAVILMEWILAAFIWFGASRRKIPLRELVGGRWAHPAQFLRDLGIGVAFVVIFGGGVLNGLGYLLKANPPSSMRDMMPRSLFEMTLWVVMSATAGYCEELIFRGYFQRQFSGWTQSAVAGIVLQGLVFGLGHGYQGWKLMSLIAFYGMCFGVLANWRRSLRPGMLAHFLQDSAGGLLYRFLG